MIYVVWFYHARAGCSRVLKYTKIGKIPKCIKMFFWQFLGIFFKKTQQHWYSTALDSENPTLGHKIFAIKSMGVFEVFLVILVKLDQQIDFSK